MRLAMNATVPYLYHETVINRELHYIVLHFRSAKKVWHERRFKRHNRSFFSVDILRN